MTILVLLFLIGFGINCSWNIMDKYQKKFWFNKGMLKGILKSCISERWNFAYDNSSEVHNP